MFRYPRYQRGFTLIELMIVVAVIAILAAIAYPSFIEQVRKARRSDAKQSLFNVAAQLETYYQDNKGYNDPVTGATGDMRDLGYSNPTFISSEKYYEIRFLGTPSRTAFTIRAVPRNGVPPPNEKYNDQYEDGCVVPPDDPGCCIFQLNSLGVTSNFKADDSQINNDRCW